MLIAVFPVGNRQQVARTRLLTGYLEDGIEDALMQLVLDSGHAPRGNMLCTFKSVPFPVYEGAHEGLADGMSSGAGQRWGEGGGLCCRRRRRPRAVRRKCRVQGCVPGAISIS